MRHAVALCFLVPFFAFAAGRVIAADGSLDPTFGNGGVAYVSPDDVGAREITAVAAVQLADGKLLFGGARNKILEGFPVYEPQIRGALVRLQADGSVDATFGNTSITGLVELPDLAATRMQSIESMAVLDDGSILAAGTSMVDGPLAGFVVRLHADGSLDTLFGNGGSVLYPGTYLHAIAVDGEGRVLAAGEHVDTSTLVYTSTVVRLLPDGSPDASFGSGGKVTLAWSDATLSGYLSALAVTPADGLVVGGGFEANGSGLGTQFALARLDANGAPDPAFAGTGWRVFADPAGNSIVNTVQRLVLLEDGRIVFAGIHTAGENITGLMLGRVLADGGDDATFGDVATPGYFTPAVLQDAESVNATALLRQPDGKLLVSANFYGPPEHMFALRATADGALDTSFGAQGVFDYDAAGGGPWSEAGTMALQRDGRIVIAGRAMRSADSPIVDFAAVRLENAQVPTDRVFADGFD